MPPQLVALTEGPNILLDKPILLLGRHQECDIQLGSRKVSRRHCCLAQVNDYLVVRDLGSTNGIRINGIRVVEGSLRAGDELTIGNQRYKVLWNIKPNEPVPSPMAGPPAREPLPVPPSPPLVPRRAEEDARLEACDDPVPLNDLVPAAVVAAPAPPQSPELPLDLPADLLEPSAPSPPVVLPDDLQLAPLSDERRRQAPDK
jgi:pSer/pThr/pTyr-binding forkhead associated (FHA) protein